MDWVSDNWGTIVMALMVLVNIINAMTEHFSTRKPGLARWLLFASDLLSVVASKGAPKKFKIPGKSSAPRS